MKSNRTIKITRCGWQRFAVTVKESRSDGVSITMTSEHSTMEDANIMAEHYKSVEFEKLLDGVSIRADKEGGQRKEASV